jgi:poly(glycerol-phosphate) alpha-glucosyltransferase
MKILFSTGNVVRQSSGPYTTLVETASQFDRIGCESTIVGTYDHGEKIHRKDLDIHAFRRVGPASFNFTFEMTSWLSQQQKSWDIASLEGVWLHPNKVVVDWCVRNNKPYVISTHGNLNPLALQISSFRKKFAAGTMLSKMFNNASCFHALTDNEYLSIRKFGIKAPVCVIPNGITIENLEKDPYSLLPLEIYGKKICLYLGRLHEIKGVDQLITAWGLLNVEKDWLLVIAGSGSLKYTAHLKSLADHQKNNIYFAGYVEGDIKKAWYAVSEFYALTSFSEALPMTVLESLSHKTPCLISHACGFQDLIQLGACTPCDVTVKSIYNGLMRMILMSDKFRSSLGEIGFIHLTANYSWISVVTEIHKVYKWILNEGDLPECVRID